MFRVGAAEVIKSLEGIKDLFHFKRTYGVLITHLIKEPWEKGNCFLLYFDKQCPSRIRNWFHLLQSCRTDLRLIRSGLRLTGSGLKLPGSGLRLTGSGLRLTGNGLRLTGSGLRLIRSGLRLTESGLGWNGSKTSEKDFCIDFFIEIRKNFLYSIFFLINNLRVN